MRVTVQIAPDRPQIKAKGRSLQVQVSTFNAELRSVSGELNSYGIWMFGSGVCRVMVHFDDPVRALGSF